jgi:hypothetical protein
MGAQSGPVADYLYAWMAGQRTAPGLEELHTAVTSQLADDPALRQLTRDAATGTPSPRTKRRVNDAVDQAAEDDQAFADHVRDLLAGLRTTATAKKTQRPGFDPFALIPVFPHFVRNRTSAWMLIPGIVIGLLIIAGTALEGTLGSVRDVAFVRDVRYAFSGAVPETEPNFPLARDVTSLFLFLVTVAGLILLHSQWKALAAAIPKLRENGVIIPRRQPVSNRLTRLLGIDRLLGPCADFGALDRLEQRMSEIKLKTRVFLAVGVLIGGFILATLALNGLSVVNFKVLVPTDASPPDQRAWLAEAQSSWWASGRHPLGLVLFALAAWFAMELILASNTVGVVSVYVAVALYFVAEMSADWRNRDGRYGWHPVVPICRTVYLCLVLLGAGISFVVVSLGTQIIFSLIGLVALYVLLLPLFTVVPWAVFRRVELQARARRRAELVDLGATIKDHDLERLPMLVAEFTRCRKAHINPMRLSGLPSGAFATVVLLPIILTVLQIFAQVGLGRSGG